MTGGAVYSPSNAHRSFAPHRSATGTDKHIDRALSVRAAAVRSESWDRHLVAHAGHGLDLLGAVDATNGFADHQRAHRERNPLSIPALPRSPTPVSTAPSCWCRRILHAAAATAGNSNDHSDHLELQNMTTMSAGAHAIKFGTWLRDNRDATTSNGGFNGSFSFPSLQAYVDTLNGLAAGQTVAQIAANCPAGQWPVRPTS